MNAATKLVRRSPSDGMIEDWIKHAKELPGVIKYQISLKAIFTEKR